MKKRLLSILLTACMVFPAGPPAAYAANATDQAERSAISEDGEGQQPDGDIQEGSGTGTTNDASLKNHSGTLTTQADLDEDLAGDGYITEVMAADKDDFLNQYRSLLAQRVAKFRVTVPLEAKMRTIDDCVPSSVVFNDEDFNSWENSQCFIDYPVTISYEGYEDEDDGLLVYLRNIVSYHLAEGHSDQQSIILTFPDKIPDGVDIEIDGMPAELNDDRTKAKTIGNYPTQTYKAEDVKIRVKFIGLHKSDIADENRILFRSWLLSSQDVYAHTGVPFEGDYLRHHLDGTPDIYVWDPVITGIDEASHTYYYDLSVDCTATYYSTGEMEDEVAAEINRVLGELDLDSKSEYEKIKAIHDYICDNTVYQYPQDGDDPPMVKHSAYSALISKKAVCDGYANLFYRMCLQAGIDARIVFGQGRSEEHAWNIVKLGSLYYDVDCTWDVNSYDYYFLLGHSEFLEDHTPKPEFTNQEFLDAYPMSETTYSPPKFKTASLILGGKIGLNMMIELPDIPDFDYDNSYVEFTVNGGKPTREYSDPNRKNSDGTLFKFTCYVNAVQMADDITAVYHYLENGKEKEISTTYTIEQYLRSLSMKYGASDEAKALARATADYGYYVQPYLADANGWSLEGENAAHTRMSFRDAAGYLNKIEEILNGIGSGPSADKASDVSSLGISLRLDTDTALNVFIYTDAEYTGTLSATVDDEAVEAIKVEEGKYQIVIPNIGAKDLNKKYKTVVTTDAGESTVEVSALDYAKIVLSNPDATYNEKQAMGAIYHYYVAAVAYANSLANANA